MTLDVRLALYHPIRSRMNTGDHIVWSSKAPLGKTIQAFTKSPYNHSSIVIRIMGYSVLRVYILEADKPGIVLRPLSMQLLGYRGQAYWQPLKKPAFNPYIKEIGFNAFSDAGTPYDFKGLFRNAFGRVGYEAKALFCSEYVGSVYKRSIPQETVLNTVGQNNESYWLYSGVALRPNDIVRLPWLLEDPILIYDQ